MRFNTISTAALFTAALVLATSSAFAPLAQANGQGLTIFGGVPTEKQLKYSFDFGGNKGSWDRYRLKIDKKKMKLAAAEITIDYPDYYKGTFNTKQMEIKVNGKAIKLQEAKWDKDNYFVQLFPAEAIPAGSDVEIIFSDVRNPDYPGTFYFNCRVLTPGDVPLLRDLGSWILSID
jgi:hypothetical protein